MFREKKHEGNVSCDLILLHGSRQQHFISNKEVVSEQDPQREIWNLNCFNTLVDPYYLKKEGNY